MKQIHILMFMMLALEIAFWAPYLETIYKTGLSSVDWVLGAIRLTLYLVFVVGLVIIKIINSKA